MTNYSVITTPVGDRATVCTNCRYLPSCFYCQLPTAESAFPDGRRLCRKCRNESITDPAEVHRLFRLVRGDLARLFGFDDQHRIILKIVDYKELNRISHGIYTPAGNSRRMSVMRYQQEITHTRKSSGETTRRVTKEKCTILVLHTMPKNCLMDALAHELAHDHLRHKVGKVNDLTLEEGFCELVAALYNQYIGNGKYNRLKDANKDPVYGGGYRKMKAIHNRTGRLSETIKYVR